MKKLEIQTIAERILAKHNIYPSKDFYLKLSNQPYMDLILERNGEIILVGHYREEGRDLISDPVLALVEINEFWYPIRIELWLGDTVCSFIQDGKRMIYPDRIKEFRAFQRMFARNIREQEWIEKGEKVKIKN